MAQQIWRANDGTEFEMERECRQYEGGQRRKRTVKPFSRKRCKETNKRKRKKRNSYLIFKTLLNLSPKGLAAQAYWEKVSQQKKSIPDENYAMISNCLSKFHRGVMNANAFYEQMDREMSLDEMKAIFRDIKFTHKIFGWDQ